MNNTNINRENSAKLSTVSIYVHGYNTVSFDIEENRT
jgi:hypothetical protein